MLTGQILLQLIVILVAVQIFGYLCKHIGQPWVIGEILAGLAFIASVSGILLPLILGSTLAFFLFPQPWRAESHLALIRTPGRDRQWQSLRFLCSHASSPRKICWARR